MQQQLWASLCLRLLPPAGVQWTVITVSGPLTAGVSSGWEQIKNQSFLIVLLKSPFPVSALFCFGASRCFDPLILSDKTEMGIKQI